MKKVFIAVLLFCVSLSAQQLQNESKNDDLLLKGVSVTIGGYFIVNGTFPASPNERVDQFVTRVYNSTTEKLLSNAGSDEKIIFDLNASFKKISYRNIKLKRADGSELKIDLMKFRINGDFKNNPYLRNDDMVLFEPVDLETSFFTITGAVYSNTKYPYVEGDKLSDAIELSGGFNKSFEIKGIQIIRLSADGNSEQKIDAGMNLNFPLQKGDRIIVVGGENRRKDYSVTILGEVSMPGIYPVKKESSTVKEVIDLAGGFKSTAMLKKARIYSNFETNFKELDPKKEFPQIENWLMLRMSNATIEDSAYLNLENNLRKLTEGVSVDFTKLDDPNSDASKFPVKDGDIIYIPQKTNTVYVFGQVPFPGQVMYVQGKDYKYYVDLAGGPGEYAQSDVMLIKGASHNWIPLTEKNAVIEEGDYIFVPKKSTKTFLQYAQEVATYTSIIGSVATLFLLVYQVTK